jgi:hypothetical protein
MTKPELAGYLSSIITILNDFDDNSRLRPQWLSAEYERVWNQWKEDVKNETGKSE